MSSDRARKGRDYTLEIVAPGG